MIEQKRIGELVIHGRKYRAHLHHLQGEEVELYRIGALAAALNKTTQAIVKWERAGLFPKPLFVITGLGNGHCARWYSKGQILNIHKVHQMFPFGLGKAYEKKRFFAAVNKVYDHIHEITIVTKDTYGKPQSAADHSGDAHASRHTGGSHPRNTRANS